MGTQQFCLRWNNHQTNMLNVFDQLLQSGDFVDVTLACEGVSIKAHKMVLSACSPYFQNLFKDNPCQHPIVILKDMRYTELRSIVDFMYKGEINVSQDQLTTLLKTAETLKVKGLAEVSSGSVPNSQGETLNANPEDQSTIPAQAIGSPPQQTPPPPQQQSLPPDGRTSPPSKRKRHRPARRPSNGDNGEASTNDMPRDVEPLPLPKSEPVDLIAEPPVELLMSADGHYQMDQSGVEHDRSHESGDRESGLAPSAVGLIAGGSPQPSTSRAQSSTQDTNLLRTRRWKYSDMRLALEAVSAGFGIKSASKRYGIPTMTLWRWTQKYGITSVYSLYNSRKAPSDGPHRKASCPPATTAAAGPASRHSAKAVAAAAALAATQGLPYVVTSVRGVLQSAPAVDRGPSLRTSPEAYPAGSPSRSRVPDAV